MKTAVFLAGSGALLAAAGPIDRRAMETEWVTDYVTVYVTAGQEAPQATNVYDVPAEPAAYTTVWVESQPETTSQAPVEYTTVWYSESESSSTSTEVAQATSVAAAPDYGSGSSTSSTSAAAPASTDSGADFNLVGDYSVILTNYHNNHRRNHSVADVAWDADLAAAAAKSAAGCVFVHDMDQAIGGQTVTYGQNIASWGSTDAPEGAENKYGAISVTNQWYNSEVENWNGLYEQANPPSDMNIDLYGHFTQVVWKDTTKVGCATQYCAAGAMYSFPAYYTVCNYLSAGNYGGEYGNNVLKTRDQPLAFHEVN